MLIFGVILSSVERLLMNSPCLLSFSINNRIHSHAVFVDSNTAGLSHPVGVAYYNDSVYYTDSDTMVGVMALIL